MDLLNLHQPWDCERFPKSKTICYGGSAPPPVKKVIKKVADQSGYTGSDLDKAGQATEKAITGGVKKTAETAKAVVEKAPPILNKASEGFDKFGRRIKTEGTKITEKIKEEGGKLASGDFSLKNAVQGTASGASETFKKSDVGKAVKTIADKSGYTGSDFDKSMQKVEKEGSNVVNQTLDVVDQPGKYVSGKLEEFKQYAADRFGYADKDDKKTARPKSRPVTPGSDKTMGQGNIEGLKGGGSLAASERSRIRQNKRKLRIARA
tara:strand:+ start:2439 stop:3230 length:792 start_codon:yes stop_codon:yes gene_type:complete